MGLFTDPIVLNDGTNDRTFTFRNPIMESGSTGSNYVEEAASAASESVIIVKNSRSNKGSRRHLLQRSEMVQLTDDATDGIKPIIVNITISHYPSHTEANIEKQLKLALAAAGMTGFVGKVVREIS